jgi:tRNA pseudouridine13 synthase
MKNKTSFLGHSKIEFYFKQSVRDFVVDEIPLYDFTEDGEHLILKIRKKNLATWDLINLLAKHLDIHKKEIGYAGLKDKNALTIQYISILKKHEEQLENFKHDNIKILEKFYHNNKIKLGHLKGNKFFIRLKKVNPTDAKKLAKAIKRIKKEGMPNYFGHQRFGVNEDNYLLGKEIIDGKRKERDKTKKRFFMNAYQSYLFNMWLSERIKISHLLENFEPKELKDLISLDEKKLKNIKKSKHPFKIMEGDLMMHYPYGRIFSVDNLEEEQERFLDKNIAPTGLLAGKRVSIAQNDANKFEEKYNEKLPLDGQRRYAWIFPDILDYKYKEDEAWFELNFTLPKGSYATVLIEELQGI